MFRVIVVDECQTGQNDCSSEAICTDTEDSYECACPHGYIDVSPDIARKPGRRCLLSKASLMLSKNLNFFSLSNSSILIRSIRYPSVERHVVSVKKRHVYVATKCCRKFYSTPLLGLFDDI